MNIFEQSERVVSLIMIKREGGGVQMERQEGFGQGRVKEKRETRNRENAFMFRHRAVLGCDWLDLQTNIPKAHISVLFSMFPLSPSFFCFKVSVCCVYRATI